MYTCNYCHNIASFKIKDYPTTEKCIVVCVNHIVFALSEKCPCYVEIL